jgi:hypothetical protein
MTKFALLPFAALLLAAGPASNAAAPPPQTTLQAAQRAAPLSPPPDPSPPAYPGEITTVMNDPDALRLMANKGVSLQWIDWGRKQRGAAVVSTAGPLWTLRAAQTAADGRGRLILDGAILEVGQGYFTFRGKIRIADTPDPGRFCEADKTWHFAITQGRKYYRLREFEWCDGLTDYIDIYF